MNWTSPMTDDPNDPLSGLPPHIRKAIEETDKSELIELSLYHFMRNLKDTPENEAQIRDAYRLGIQLYFSLKSVEVMEFMIKSRREDKVDGKPIPFEAMMAVFAKTCTENVAKKLSQWYNLIEAVCPDLVKDKAD